MDSATPPAPDNQPAPSQEPEVLQPRADDGSQVSETDPSSPSSDTQEVTKSKRRRTYRPSHKATFIGLAVVVAILAINALVLVFVLRKQSKLNDQASGQVTISQEVLDKLGVNRSSVGDSGVALTIGPSTEFKNKVKIAGDVNIAGQLNLNGKLSASDASFTQLQAGNTSLTQLNVNGDTTSSSLNLRNNLLVNGTTRLQGAVTITQLLSVTNSLNVSGNLSIGGTFSARSFTSTGTFTIGGHVITGGTTPSVSKGSCDGSNGTVSISGNDSAGTVAVNIGTGACGGSVAVITFATTYNTTPHVIITPVGAAPIIAGGAADSFYVSRSTNNFTIYVAGGLSPGGYAFDYIVEQ